MNRSDNEVTDTLEKFVWSQDRYGVGDDEIDRQHRGILEVINGLIEQVNEGSHDPKALVEVLVELNDYAVKHFQAEESLLKRLGYPLLEHQHHSHGYYTEKVSGFLLSMKQEQVALEDVLEFIGMWWEQHILVEDMGFKAFLQAKQVPQA